MKITDTAIFLKHVLRGAGKKAPEMRNNLKYRAKRQQLVLVQSSGTIEMCPLTAAALRPSGRAHFSVKKLFFHVIICSTQFQTSGPIFLEQNFFFGPNFFSDFL